MHTITRRALLVAALAVVPGLLVMHDNAVAAPAATLVRFHLALSKSEPAANDTLASPNAIKLWFTEIVKAAETGVQITGPDKKLVPTAAITIAAAAKSPAVAGIKQTLKPGVYSVAWKTMADDGHPTRGTFVFTVGAKKDAR